MIGAASSGAQTWQIIAGVGPLLLGLYVFAGTGWGRARVRRMFTGQSIQQLTSTWADQIAATQAAYTVSESERRKLEEKVTSLLAEIADLRQKLEDLRLIVTAREEVIKLAADEATRHIEIMSALERIGGR